MILSTHALFGAALANFFPSRPIEAFLAGFMSHFILDALPHWDYKIRSDSIRPDIGAKIKWDKDFLIDALKIGIDIFVGIALSLIIFEGADKGNAIFWGAIGGIMPDPLQFLYNRFKREPLISLQNFHKKIQENNHIFKEAPRLGAFIQLIFICLIVLISKSLTD